MEEGIHRRTEQFHGRVLVDRGQRAAFDWNRFADNGLTLSPVSAPPTPPSTPRHFQGSAEIKRITRRNV